MTRSSKFTNGVYYLCFYFQVTCKRWWRNYLKHPTLDRSLNVNKIALPWPICSLDRLEHPSGGKENARQRLEQAQQPLRWQILNSTTETYKTVTQTAGLEEVMTYFLNFT